MFRIDSPDSVGGQFSQGNPGTGQPGTVVSADWLNAVQEEIAHVVEATYGAGTLNKSDSGQLEEAIDTKVANAAATAANALAAQVAAITATIAAKATPVVTWGADASGSIFAQKGDLTVSLFSHPSVGVFDYVVTGLTASMIAVATTPQLLLIGATFNAGHLRIVIANSSGTNVDQTHSVVVMKL